MFKYVTKRRMLGSYLVALVLLLYFGLNGLIFNAIGDSFPNPEFVLSLTFLVLGAWGIGIGMRKYLKTLTEEAITKMKSQIVLSAVIGWIIVLGAISFFPLIF
ncbi:hypothetical protein [Sporosarcina gallistercoris]|uniref:Uncharacterized protein n=1 Tax=Sporosarcina gallistercoris TaxID=2762245 RepID=A0ABR8PJU8_9BACL|nr:hypothetical protein [Sporosarcina gallistercoris]MBD7908429.1 hypothetical protein [Sporosarcina gallistercoris]